MSIPDLVAKLQKLKTALAVEYKRYFESYGVRANVYTEDKGSSDVIRWVYLANSDGVLFISEVGKVYFNKKNTISNQDVLSLIQLDDVEFYYKSTLEKYGKTFNINSIRNFIPKVKARYETVEGKAPYPEGKLIEALDLQPQLVLLYRCLELDIINEKEKGSNLHLSVPPELIQKHIDIELFGTEINTTVDFCAPFSISIGNKNINGNECVGSFFSYQLEEDKRYLANPPFDEHIVLLMAQRLISELERINGNTSVIVVIPKWKWDGIDLLRNSTYYVTEVISNKRKNKYYSFSEDIFIEASSCYIILMGNSDKSVLTEFMKDWYEGPEITLIMFWEDLEEKIINRPLKQYKPSKFPKEIPKGEYSDLLPKKNIYTQSIQSTLNTAKYLYYGMRNGILLQIRNGVIIELISFFNPDFQSLWGPRIVSQLDKSLERYYLEKRKVNRFERVNADPTRWWLNGSIIDNEISYDGKNEHYINEMYDLFDRALKRLNSNVDLDIFINKRDHPQLRPNLIQPYDFVHPSITNSTMTEWFKTQYPDMEFTPFFEQETKDNGKYRPFPIISNSKYNLAPIVSPFSDSRFLDILAPAADHVKIDIPLDKVHKWEQKTNTIIFRGTASGGGTTHIDNQRIRCAWINALLDKKKFEVPLTLNTKISALSENDKTKGRWNYRDKKLRDDSPMTYTNTNINLPGDIPYSKLVGEYISTDEQSKCKYVLYINGHVAAERYVSLLRQGFCILKVSSISYTPGNELYFYPRLKGVRIDNYNTNNIRIINQDHFIIDPDYSNYGATIEYLSNNSSMAKRVSENGYKFYLKYLTRSQQEIYVGELLTQLCQ